MIMTDGQIQRAIESGEISVIPLDSTQIQPASVDLHLGTEILLYRRRRRSFIDWLFRRPERPLYPELGVSPLEDLEIRFLDQVGYQLKRGEFVLGTTAQSVCLDLWTAARIEGKSTLGRLGLIVHSTAGFVDPGFTGQLTLEMTNLNRRPIQLRPGMKIAQLSFMKLSESVLRPYGHPDLGSHYQNQKGPVQPAPLSSFNAA